MLGAAAEIAIGMSEGDLLALMGKPSSRMAKGGQSILKWPELSATLENGKVVKVMKLVPQTAPRVASAPPEIEGFRDLKWGDDLTKREDFASLSKTASYGVVLWSRKNEKLAIGDLGMREIVYTTFEGRLAEVLLLPKPSVSFPDLITAFTAKYGEPAFKDYNSAMWRRSETDQALGEAFVIDGSTSLSATLSCIELKRLMEAAKTRSLGKGAKSDL